MRARRAARVPGLAARSRACSARRSWCSRRAACSVRTRRVAACAEIRSSAASSRCTRMRSAGCSQRSAAICRSVRPAARCRSSRSVNSNKTAPMTGMSPKASGAPGRCGAWVAVEAGGGGDQAPDGQAGRQPGFGPRGAAGQQHRADPGCPVQGEEQQVRPGSAQAHVVAREPGQALGGDPGGDRGEPAEQQVLGSGCRRFPRVRPAAHRLPETACAASGLPENRQPGWLTSFPSARAMPGCRRAGAQAVVPALLAVCGRRPIIM